MISPLKAFAIALAVGAAVPLAYAGKVRFDTMQAEQADRAFESSYKELAPGVYVTAQIKPDDLARFRDRADRGDVGNVHRRVGGGFEEKHLCVGPDRGFPRIVVARIDHGAFDAETWQQVVDHPAARPEQCARRDEVVPRR